jgi:hypothetical protein
MFRTQESDRCGSAGPWLPVVWACAAAGSTWAVLHVIGHHGGRVKSTVVLEIDVPRSWLRKGRAGLWYSVRDTPPGQIKRVLCFGKLAGAPAA